MKGAPKENKLPHLVEKWPALKASPKVVTVLKEGYTPLPVPTKSDKVTNDHNLLCKFPQEPLPIGSIASIYDQKCSRTGHNSDISRVLHRAIHGSQTQQLVETHTRHQYPEQIFKDRAIQTGNSRDNKDHPIGSVGYLQKFQRCLLPHTDSKSVQVKRSN